MVLVRVLIDRESYIMRYYEMKKAELVQPSPGEAGFNTFNSRAPVSGIGKLSLCGHPLRDPETAHSTRDIAISPRCSLSLPNKGHNGRERRPWRLIPYCYLLNGDTSTENASRLSARSLPPGLRLPAPRCDTNGQNPPSRLPRDETRRSLYKYTPAVLGARLQCCLRTPHTLLPTSN